MINKLQEDLEKSMKGLVDIFNESEKKLTKQELSVLNDYKKAISKALKTKDFNSLHKIMADLQVIINKNE